MKLKPCPFCGGKATLVVYPASDLMRRWSDKYAVQCTYTGDAVGCGAEGQHHKIKDLAIAAWNRRTRREHHVRVS